MNKKKIQKKIGLRIRQMRLNSGITQEELADSIGKQREAINRLEAGNINPTLYFLQEIAEGLEVNLGELLKGFSK